MQQLTIRERERGREREIVIIKEKTNMKLLAFFIKTLFNNINIILY